jgi:hypothetical protein
MGSLKAGFEDFESRWDRSNAPPKTLVSDLPIWEGQKLTGQAIVVWEEQGLGDLIQFSRLKGVGQVYRQPFIDTYAKAAKLHDRKTPIMAAADLRNGRVLALPRGERRRTACSHRSRHRIARHPRPHESKLALAVENIDPPAARAEPLAGFARTKAGSP